MCFHTCQEACIAVKTGVVVGPGCREGRTEGGAALQVQGLILCGKSLKLFARCLVQMQDNQGLDKTLTTVFPFQCSLNETQHVVLVDPLSLNVAAHSSKVIACMPDSSKSLVHFSS